MSPAERHNIQYFLSAKGLYLSDIDGLWGAGTEASVLELQRVYPEQYAQFDINTVDGAIGFLKWITIDFMEEYPEGVTRANLRMSRTKELKLLRHHPGL